MDVYNERSIKWLYTKISMVLCYGVPPNYNINTNYIDVIGTFNINAEILYIKKLRKINQTIVKKILSLTIYWYSLLKIKLRYIVYLIEIK